MAIDFHSSRFLILSGLLFFAATATAQSDLDDILGGFEEDPEFIVQEHEENQIAPKRSWDISGSAEISGSFNFRQHDSATGADYHGLQRLRSRLNLQVDANLTENTKLRLEGWGFYDVAYQIHGRDRYTNAVLGEYEKDSEFGELWIRTRLSDDIDLKVGRQIVIWGHSENLRVLDVINPIDNREPGRVDLEDQRLPLGMIRADAFFGHWSLTGLIIPELRFDINPVLGSDFYPSTSDFPVSEPEHFSDSEFALAVKGTFSGLDISFHAARFYNDVPRFQDGPMLTRLVHDRLKLFGFGGAKTAGPWLWKSEIAYVDGLGFFNGDEQDRLDVLLGVEYFGWANTSLSLDIVNRTLIQYENAMQQSPDFVRRNSQEVAVRFSQDRMNDRLHFLALGLARGWDGQDGSLFRFDVNYDVLDSLTLGVGLMLYQSGDLPPFDQFESNDRAIFSIKWSF